MLRIIHFRYLLLIVNSHRIFYLLTTYLRALCIAKTFELFISEDWKQNFVILSDHCDQLDSPLLLALFLSDKFWFSVKILFLQRLFYCLFKRGLASILVLHSAWSDLLPELPS